MLTAPSARWCRSAIRWREPARPSPSSGPGRRWARSSSPWSEPMTADLTRWWWVRHAPVPDGGFIYGQRDLDCDCGDVEVFCVLGRELPADAVWVTSNL